MNNPDLAIPAQALPLETFEENTLHAFLERWHVRDDMEAARSIYHVMAESNKQFLHADANHQAVQIGFARRSHGHLGRGMTEDMWPPTQVIHVVIFS